jgi:hypothetical protein
MAGLTHVADLFRMTDEAWQRHANPWSVWTRFAAIPAFILAVWSRAWIGWWALVPIAVVVVWLWLNPRAFPAVTEPRSWAAKGIYGEKLWLAQRRNLPAGYRPVLRFLGVVGGAGFVLLLVGLVTLLVWPTVFGASLIILAQLWRIDRLGRLYDERQPGVDGRPSSTYG